MNISAMFIIHWQTNCENCYRKSKRKFDLPEEELREMVWKYPTTQLAKMFGVSDSAIAHRCKRLGIKKPPRGYWSKLKFNKL
jgi:hypothetical protein